jgi:hypothetical protein
MIRLRTLCVSRCQSMRTELSGPLRMYSEKGHERWTNIVSTLSLLGIRSLNVLLEHSIAVNISHGSYGYYKPGLTSPHCIRLVIWRK